MVTSRAVPALDPYSRGMAWIDPEWELDPNEDAKKMARAHPPAKTAENRRIGRVVLAVAVVMWVCFIGAAIVLALHLL